MVLFAMYSSLKTPVSNWNTEFLDTILYEGNEFYLGLLNQLNIPIRYLGVDDLIGIHSVFGEQISVSSYIMFPEANHENSQIVQYIRYCHDGLIEYNDILTQLQTMLTSNCKFGIFICNAFTYGLIKHQNLLYLFDSHSKNYAGDSIHNGTSSLRSFISLNEMTNYLLKINPINMIYQLSYITIDIITEEDVHENLITPNSVLVKSISSMSLENSKLYLFI
jgi:hypothetical protein